MFPQTRGSHESSIKIITIDNPEKLTLEGAKKIYSSPLADPGNMKFTPKDNKIWFIKDISENKSVATTKTEAASVNIATGDVIIESDLSGATQLVNMDGHILLPFRGQLFSVTGKADLKTNVLENPLAKIKKKTEEEVTTPKTPLKAKTPEDGVEIDDGGENDDVIADDEDASSSPPSNPKQAGRKTVVEKLNPNLAPKLKATKPAPDKAKLRKKPDVTEKQSNEEEESDE